MPNPVNLIRYALFSLVPAAFYTLWIISYRKGLAEHWFFDKEMPGNPDAKLFMKFTGLKIFDTGLKALVLSFWPVCNGQNPSLSLFAIPFTFAAAVPYILLSLEARRTKSVLSVAWRLAWFGVLQFYLTQALLLPLYCAITLAPTGNKKRQRPAPFRSAPYMKTCIIMGYYIYLPLLALPSPGVLSHPLKQILISSIIGWTLWVFFMFSVASYTKPQKTNNVQSESHRRSLYILALATSSTSYLAALLIPLFLEAPCDGCVEDLRPWNVFIPALPWSIARFSSLLDGVVYFFQWDFIIANAALVLWAVGVFVRDCGERVNGYKMALEVLGLSALASPAGAAVVLIWRLDRILGNKQGKGE